MRDRLAHLEVGQFLAAMVDLDDQLVGQPLIALGDHLEARHLGDAVEVGQRHGGKGGELDFLSLQRACRRGAVRQHLIDDLVEIGLVLAPIVGVLLQPVIFAGLVFGEFERAGADRRIVGRVRRRCRRSRRRASAPRWSAPASALRISWNGVGLANLNTAVRSSGVSTASRSLNTVRPRFCSGFQICSAEKATSAEVKGLPSCHLTPSRNLKVTDRPSAAPSQPVQGAGRARPCRRRRLRPAAPPSCSR